MYLKNVSNRHLVLKPAMRYRRSKNDLSLPAGQTVTFKDAKEYYPYQQSAQALKYGNLLEIHVEDENTGQDQAKTNQRQTSAERSTQVESTEAKQETTESTTQKKTKKKASRSTRREQQPETEGLFSQTGNQDQSSTE